MDINRRGYVLAIQGIEFDLFEEQLSSDAQNNLKEASEFFELVGRRLY